MTGRELITREEGWQAAALAETPARGIFDSFHFLDAPLEPAAPHEEAELEWSCRLRVYLQDNSLETHPPPAPRSCYFKPTPPPPRSPEPAPDPTPWTLWPLRVLDDEQPRSGRHLHGLREVPPDADGWSAIVALAAAKRRQEFEVVRVFYQRREYCVRFP